MAVNSLGLGGFEVQPEREGEFYGAKYAGLSPEEAAAINRPPPPPPRAPMAPRRLPQEEVRDRLQSAEAALNRLERAKGRADFDAGPLMGELKGTLELLSGEFGGLLKDIQSGRIPGLIDGAFFVRLRKSRLLLTDLAVAKPDFLTAARGVLATLKDWPEEFPSPDPVCQAGGS